jgi:hypothetical protein
MPTGRICASKTTRALAAISASQQRSDGTGQDGCVSNRDSRPISLMSVMEQRMMIAQWADKRSARSHSGWKPSFNLRPPFPSEWRGSTPGKSGCAPIVRRSIVAAGATRYGARMIDVPKHHVSETTKYKVPTIQALHHPKAVIARTTLNRQVGFVTLEWAVVVVRSPELAAGQSTACPPCWRLLLCAWAAHTVPTARVKSIKARK